MNQRITVSIIIPSYNTKELLKKCLESVASTYHLLPNAEIIVVDNASTDGTIEYVKSFRQRRIGLWPKKLKLTIIENTENLGFARAVNQGIKAGMGEYFLILNSDIEVKKGAIGKLLEFAKKNSGTAVVGARLLNPDGSPQASVYHFPTASRAIKEYWLGQKGAYEKYAPIGDQSAKVDAVVGAVMLIPRKTVEKIGLFDEKYFMYFEDLDYCRKAGKAGLSIWYLPEAELVHHHGASGKTMPETTREWLTESAKKYHGLLKYWLITIIIRFAFRFGRLGQKTGQQVST